MAGGCFVKRYFCLTWDHQEQRCATGIYSLTKQQPVKGDLRLTWDQQGQHKVRRGRHPRAQGPCTKPS